MKLNEWVKAARKHKGLTLEKLGEAMSRTKATVGFWEKGSTAPSFDQVLQIAEITGFPIQITDIKVNGYEPEAIGAMIQQLGAMLQVMTPMERAGLAPIISRMVEDPSLTAEAAAMAMRISKRPDPAGGTTGAWEWKLVTPDQPAQDDQGEKPA